MIVAPHALAWTDEMAALNGQSAMESILAVAAGRTPRHVVNRDVLDAPLLREKLARYGGRET